MFEVFGFKFDTTFAFELSAEFIASIVFGFVLIITLQPFGFGYGAFLVFTGAAFTIYTFGRHCGCHFNPAITTGLMVCGKFNVVRGICYILAQFCGFLVASGLYLVAPYDLPGLSWKGGILPINPGPLSTNLAAIFMEMICCFILVLVVCRVAIVNEPRYEEDMSKEKFVEVSDKKELFLAKRSIAIPLAIAGALGFLAFPSGYVSGGAYNPAAALGRCVGGHDCSKIWVYFIGDFIGGALAGGFDWLFFQKKQEADADVSQFYGNNNEM